MPIGPSMELTSETDLMHAIVLGQTLDRPRLVHQCRSEISILLGSFGATA